MVNKKFIFRVLVNSLIGVLLIFIWSRFVNFYDIWQILKKVKVYYLLIYFFVFLLTGTVRGLRFRLLLNRFPLTWRDSVMLTLLSQFLSFLIPLRVGELTKSAYLTSQFQTPLPKSITWVFIDRFLDFWMILFTVILALVYIPTQIPSNIFKLMIGILILFSISGALILKSQSHAKKMVKILSKLLVFRTIKTGFVRFCDSVIDGFVVLKRPGIELAGLIALTLLAVFFDCLLWIIVYASLGKEITLPMGLLGNGLMAFTFLIPAAPGYVGSAEASGLIIFSGVLKFDPNLASAAAVLFHILTVVALPVFGVFCLFFLKFNLRLVWTTLKGNKLTV